MVAVGDWEWDLGYLPSLYEDYIVATGEQRMYEAYACLRKGDVIVNSVQAGGHTRMVAQDAVVVRTETGEIDGMESYILTHEQGAPRTKEPYFSSWAIDRHLSFSSIFLDWYVPCTMEAFVTGEFQEPMAEMRDGAEGKLGLTTGTVKTNYHIESVTLKIVDSKGEEVFNHIMFPSVGKVNDSSDNHSRSYIDTVYMGRFATPLSDVYFELGETYNYDITVHIAPGQTFKVHESSFTYGSAD
jgi:hypothetical protein